VVPKPAEWTRVQHRAGLGEQAGAAHVAHPDVPPISFTGETVTGQVIMRSAATTSRACRWSWAARRPA
jgi:5-carboxymethyl-2-hydroxymuconic-semialdehyde dehydrogenase